MDKLKPCPFCGHEAMISYNSNYDFQAYCTNDACFMSQIIMEDMETEEQARAAWNKRAPSVPGVPLDKLCEWLADNYEPPANVSNGKALDNHEFCVTLWRYVLEKMMEEQDAKEET